MICRINCKLCLFVEGISRKKQDYQIITFRFGFSVSSSYYYYYYFHLKTGCRTNSFCNTMQKSIGLLKLTALNNASRKRKVGRWHVTMATCIPVSRSLWTVSNYRLSPDVHFNGKKSNFQCKPPKLAHTCKVNKKADILYGKKLNLSHVSCWKMNQFYKENFARNDFARPHEKSK